MKVLFEGESPNCDNEFTKSNMQMMLSCFSNQARKYFQFSEAP